MNTVTLFSNGIGHFRRAYDVTADERTISIPFKTDCIGDVASSLQVFGKVRLTAPPSFTPANSNATSLNIDQSNALTSLLRQLSGANIEVSPSTGSNGFVGTLLGVETETAERDGAVLQRPFVVVLTETGIRKLPFEYMQNVGFTEDSVRTEITKALKANFQRIKPDSTLVDVTVVASDKPTEAIVQYTIPVAAWKMRYAIRQGEETFTLEGAAIIDNNTDEDWDDFVVSVVTGNPISFNTDIANVVVPHRRMIHLVENTALGNVDVEEGSVMMAACMEASAPRARGGQRKLAMKQSVSNAAQFGLESMDDASEIYSAEVAQAPEVESKEVGDFSVFTAKQPLTILARKSAVVPMFTVTLKHAGVVLLYKETNHATRPYRAIKFKNETDYSLGRGKTVIYNEGVFSGECVLETTKPKENRMLPHCLENGVKITKRPKGVETRRSSLNISDGVVIDEQVSTAVTEYVIRNKKDEPFKLALEHMANVDNSRSIVGFDGVEIKDQEKLSDGWRLYFELTPNQEVTLTATETLVEQRRVMFGHHFDWLRLNIIHQESPLAEDKQIQVCAAIQMELDKVVVAAEEANVRSLKLEAQAERVRQNIGVTQQKDTDTVTKWVEDLDATEQAIRKIEEKTVPELTSKQKDLREKLGKELKKISVTWKAT